MVNVRINTKQMNELLDESVYDCVCVCRCVGETTRSLLRKEPIQRNAQTQLI